MDKEQQVPMAIFWAYVFIINNVEQNETCIARYWFAVANECIVILCPG